MESRSKQGSSLIGGFFSSCLHEKSNVESTTMQIKIAFNACFIEAKDKAFVRYFCLAQ